MNAHQHALAATLGALVTVGVAVLAARGSQQPAAAKPPPARPPAASLARPASPSRAPDAAGFIQRWLLLEPIRVSNQLTESAVQAAVTKYAFARSSMVPRDGQTVTVGDESAAWHAVDTLDYNVNLFHFAYALNKPTSNVLFWAVTVVHVPRDLPGMRLAIGSNAASVWWLDDEEVIALYNDRQAVIDDGVSRRTTLARATSARGSSMKTASGHRPHRKPGSRSMQR